MGLYRYNTTCYVEDHHRYHTKGQNSHLRIIQHDENKKSGKFYWETKIKIRGARWQGSQAHNLATFWVPSNGRRMKGRPIMRWVDEVVRVAGSNWATLTRDKRRWTDLTEAYTQVG